MRRGWLPTPSNLGTLCARPFTEGSLLVNDKRASKQVLRARVRPRRCYWGTVSQRTGRAVSEFATRFKAEDRVAISTSKPHDLTQTHRSPHLEENAEFELTGSQPLGTAAALGLVLLGFPKSLSCLFTLICREEEQGGTRLEP